MDLTDHSSFLNFQIDLNNLAAKFEDRAGITKNTNMCLICTKKLPKNQQNIILRCNTYQCSPDSHQVYGSGHHIKYEGECLGST